MNRLPVRLLTTGLLLAALAHAPAEPAQASSIAAPSPRASITDFGAVADGKTLNTTAIQSAIDHLATHGGGTLVIPKGTFLSGALFLKPGVNLYLEQDATLRCSTDMKDFPPQRTRIEGHFEDAFTPALLNAKNCDGLHITGPGTLDGAGRPTWDLFWKLRNESKDKKNFRNLSIPRARLCLIESSQRVVITDVTFKDSQFWNLHLYKCRSVMVEDSRFQVPDDYQQAPSTDGIDVDSCQNVFIDGCSFSVTDDCIALKGSKGPNAADDKDSPPVEHVRISNCTFKRGGGVLTLGSEATTVRDVVAEHCTVTGPVPIAQLKLRPDTPQHYEDIHFRNITIDGTGAIVSMKPWTQYFDLKGQSPPHSVVRNLTLTNIHGRAGSFGTLQGNPNQTDISDVTLENIDVQLKNPQLKAVDVKNLKVENVAVNGKPFTLHPTQ